MTSPLVTGINIKLAGFSVTSADTIKPGSVYNLATKVSLQTWMDINGVLTSLQITGQAGIIVPSVQDVRRLNIMFIICMWCYIILFQLLQLLSQGLEQNITGVIEGDIDLMLEVGAGTYELTAKNGTFAVGGKMRSWYI